MGILGSLSEADVSGRLARRPEPRFTFLLAAAGAVLAASGATLVGADQGDLAHPGQTNLWGAGLCTATVIAGFVLLSRVRSGPLATAGSVAIVVGTPATVFFLTGSTNGPTLEAIFSITAVVYLISWAIGPARGRTVFLGGGLVALWLFVREALDPVVGSMPGSTLPTPDSLRLPIPFVGGADPMLSGVTSLVFGVAYLIVARLWDRDGSKGAAVGPAAAGLLATFAGVAMLAVELEPVTVGFLLLIIGIALATNGATTGRRVTTWLGGGAVATGSALVVADIVESLTAAGVGFIVVGGCIVAGSVFGQIAISEPDEVDEPRDRLRERPRPRLTPTLGAAGAAVVAAGAAIIGLDGLGGGSSSSQVPGIAASVALVGVGYFLLWSGGHGARGSAGSVAAITGVPALMLFITVDLDGGSLFSVLGLLAVSVAAWLPTWFWTKRPSFLGAGVFAVWLLLLELVEEAGSFIVSDDGLIGIFFGFFGRAGSFPEIPDPTVLGGLTLVVAGACMALGTWFDRRSMSGAATPLVAPTVVCSTVGLAFLAGDLEEVGVGIGFTAIGCALAFAGAASRRRATSWFGVAGIVYGVTVLIGDFVDSATTGGLVSIVIGAAIVAVAHWLSTQTNEPDEMESRTVPAAVPIDGGTDGISGF